ncbi:MAG: hypothetical protein EBR82_00295 [Caulobacteraceae bacterium]|nr:hypothetical protein [Caulobacteraceae bacterium]
MRYATTTSVFLTIMFLVDGVRAGDAQCATVKDHDLRMACYAFSEGRISWCEFIKDHDARVMCRIRVDSKKAH